MLTSALLPSVIQQLLPIALCHRRDSREGATQNPCTHLGPCTFPPHPSIFPGARCFPAMSSSNVEGQREEAQGSVGGAPGSSSRVLPDYFSNEKKMRKPSESKGWKLPISCKLFFFLLYYSELFCFSELPCVGWTNPTDSRMGDDESLSKCRIFSPFFS